MAPDGTDFPLYNIGSKLNINPHQPLRPDGFDTQYPLLDDEDKSEMLSMSPLQRCALHRPKGNRKYDQHIPLNVLSVLRSGPGAQLLVISSTDLAKKSLVAKVFDPLLYKHGQSGWDIDTDPFKQAEFDYAHESWAYSQLKHLQGTIIPQYYGSFLFESSEDKRSVCLILLEKLRGRFLSDLNPIEFSQALRMTIVKAVIDAESCLYKEDLIHCDIHPRNICIEMQKNEVVRVTIIDFAQVAFSRTPPDSPEWLQKAYEPGKSINPILRWHEFSGLYDSMRPWVDWEWRSWLMTTYASSTAYATVTMEMADTFLLHAFYKHPEFRIYIKSLFGLTSSGAYVQRYPSLRRADEELTADDAS
jgi:serine/threonine protein kinase